MALDGSVTDRTVGCRDRIPNCGDSVSTIDTAGEKAQGQPVLQPFRRTDRDRRPAQARLLRDRVHARQLVRAGAQRQIATLYFKRSGLSKDKEKLSQMVQQGVETAETALAIRDPCIFEFLGLRARDVMTESDLEAARVEHLREFCLSSVMASVWRRSKKAS